MWRVAAIWFGISTGSCAMGQETHRYVDLPFDGEMRYVDNASHVGVMVLGGSMGGIAEDGVRWYAECGFPALGVA